MIAGPRGSQRHANSAHRGFLNRGPLRLSMALAFAQFFGSLCVASWVRLTTSRRGSDLLTGRPQWVSPYSQVLISPSLARPVDLTRRESLLFRFLFIRAFGFLPFSPLSLRPLRAPLTPTKQSVGLQSFAADGTASQAPISLSWESLQHEVRGMSPQREMGD